MKEDEIKFALLTSSSRVGPVLAADLFFPPVSTSKTSKTSFNQQVCRIAPLEIILYNKPSPLKFYTTPNKTTQ
jgi:hypothetical protein